MAACSRRALLATGAAGLLAGCAATRPPATAPATTGATAADAALQDLLARSNAARLEREPLLALYRGDPRGADRFGDGLSDAYLAAERAAVQAERAALAAIPHAVLSPLGRTVHDAFAWQLDDRLAAVSPPAAGVWPFLPLDQLNGPQLYFTQLSAGDGAAPYASAEDYERGLARLDDFARWLGLATARLREGVARGVVQPRVVVDAMLPQFDALTAQDAATTPYLGPVRRWPDTLPPGERARLAQAYADRWERRLRPALRRVQHFLAETYRPAARDSVGLSALPGGAEAYAQRVRSHTTTALSADEIHALGLDDVARLDGEIDALRRDIGFAGDRAAFFAHLRSAAAFQPASAEAIADGYRAIGRRVDAALPRLFATRPATPLEVRPMPALEARGGPGAYYVPGAPAQRRPGVFFFNGDDLAARSTWGMETLYLHEAVPGHHLQNMLAIEDPRLPALLRFDGPTAFFEGWALYAESLGAELGLFTDPYQRFGHLNDAMLRAMRLVVDTGLHARGWTRAEAIGFMQRHSAMAAADVVAEVDRYIVDPGQALAYRIGERTIRGLRGEAEAAFGDRFDPRAFHAQVLATGAVPMAVLQSRLRAWIAAGVPADQSIR